MILALKMKEEAMSQGELATSRNWKGQGNSLPPRVPRKCTVLLTSQVYISKTHIETLTSTILR